MRTFFSSLVQEEMRQLHLLTTEKLVQLSRQQQQLTERLLAKHAQDILRTVKESSAPRTTYRTAGEGARGTALLIQRILSPGDTFVDIGTGVGAHTVTVAHTLGAQGRIVAFDPFPPAREAVRLDDVLGQGARADLVRIEAGTSILQVFEGASGVLESNPNIALIVERGAAEGPIDGSWLAFLTSLGFEHAVIDPVSVDPVKGRGRIGEHSASASLLLLARPGSSAWARLRSLK